MPHASLPTVISAVGGVALLALPECEPPVALCEDQVVYAAEGTCSACVSIDAGSYDPDGDEVNLMQFPPCDYPVGTTRVRLTVADTQDLSHCWADVTVIGGAPAEIETWDLEVWPPDHSMQDFVLSDCAAVTGGCGEALDIDLDGTVTSVYSDEPEDAKGGGDGHTVDDIAFAGADFSVRAERQGSGNGRVYGVSFTVSNDIESVEGTCHVSVPHDDSGEPAVDDGAAAGYSLL